MSTFRLVAFTTTIALSVAACGASFPPPNERLASAEAAVRSARELGAEKDAKAALHLKLAEEQLAQAKKLVNDDNQRADAYALRASSDAELAVMLAKEKRTNEEVDRANEKVKAVKGGGQ